MQEIANVLGIPDEAAKYVNILKRGKKAYHALLWNGNLSILVSKSFFSVHSVEEGAMAVRLQIEQSWFEPLLGLCGVFLGKTRYSLDAFQYLSHLVYKWVSVNN